MNEHQIFIPNDADWVIDGERLAIVGYSHHSEAKDSDSLTQDVMGHVLKGKRIPFFTRISGYFGKSNEEFWPHVAFFNFVPTYIGTSAEKYLTASEAQHKAGHDRVLLFLEENRIDRILVFSTKAWDNFPFTDGDCPSIFETPEEHTYRAEVGTYTVKGWHVLAGGFRHPERARRDEMTLAVQTFMKMPLPKH